MKTITGYIKTNKVGSTCEFDFEVDDDATDEDIEQMAQEAAFNLVEWDYKIDGEPA